MQTARFTFECEPESAALIRATVNELLRNSMPSADLRELMVGVGEAVANAIEHGRGPIHVDVEVGSDEATVTVGDFGAGIDPERLGASRTPAALDAESGRGLYLMSQMCDSVVVRQNRGCTVSIAKQFGPGRPRPPRPNA